MQFQSQSTNAYYVGNNLGFLLECTLLFSDLKIYASKDNKKAIL